MYFDSHCHLTDEKLVDDVDAVIGRARDAGVRRMVTIASNVFDARRAVEIAEANEGVWCSAGVHPHVADGFDDATTPMLRELIAREAVVALGETGLDYHYDNSDRAAQRRSFDAHLALASETGIPVVVHARDADDDVAAAIRSAGPVVRGVLHCFAGGRDLLDAGLEAGWCVSFSGLVSFSKYDAADLLRAVPDDRLLIETDSPYLAPVPHRGSTNQPAWVVEVARAVAEHRGVDPERVAGLTYENASRFYGVSVPATTESRA